MIWHHNIRLGALLGVLVVAAACARPPAAEPGPSVPPEFAALPDTLVCVIDRASPRGLRELPAKASRGGVVVLLDGEIAALETLHPTNLIAGYAGREGWLVRGDPITLDGQRFRSTGGERRVPLTLIRRAGEFQGIMVFAGEDDPPPPDALYIPTAPGCIFQAYVREDLMRP